MTNTQYPVAYLANSSPHSGVGQYASELKRALQSSDFRLREFLLQRESLFVDGDEKASIRRWPSGFGAKSIVWVRVGKKVPSFLTNETLVHATNQTLSFIKTSKPLLVTVHDIIEMLQPQDKMAFYLNKYLYSGIEKAEHVIAVSEYTKKTIMDYYGLPAEDISVIHSGVNPAVFYPIENFKETVGYKSMVRELGIIDRQPLIIYVGSDHPRKNVPVALEAFAGLLKDYPQAVFLKVGLPGLPAGRADTLEAIDKLGIREQVKFISDISDERLNELYNSSDVLIFPSLFEGFGMPPLEAMASGLPVVTSNATSLPEVVGQAGRMHDPNDVEQFKASLLEIIQNKDVSDSLAKAGIEQAKKFSWGEAAKATTAVYHSHALL
ncbi:MAG: glycosyltransferase family 4 protein [Candidatus Andersenbacteria bacterium]|nr:glycosyltransferase family 4 protein [Candidatus Andersenbacteria bacterium]